MARDDLNELSVLGFSGSTPQELADDIQTNLIDKWSKTRKLSIAERQFFNPTYEGAQYGALIFYALDPLPEETKPADLIAVDKKKPTATKGKK